MKKSTKTWGITLIIAATFMITCLLNPLQPISDTTSTTTYHTPAWLKQQLTLGYSRSLAVLYWFNVISNFSGKNASEADYSILAEKLDTITTLDPYAGHAYYTAATTLTWQLHATTLSAPLLERGIYNMPDEWRWPYYRGFYSYLFDHDTKTATKYLTMAAKHPNVPPLLIRLTSRLRAAQSGLTSAELFLRQMLKKRQDPTIKENLKKEIKQIQTERVLQKLDRALSRIPNWQGNVRQLKSLGIHLPRKLPDGGTIIFNKQHQPISSIEKKRYKLFQSSAYRRNSQ